MQTRPIDSTDENLIKSFPAFILETKEDGDFGIVRAIVSVMGNIDHHMEVIVNGAFTKTITERWQKIRILDNHNWFSAQDAIAKLLAIREVGKNELPQQLLDKYPDATGGLYIECQFLMDNPTDKSYQIYKRIKAGLIDEYSIGFQIVKSDWREINTDGGKRDVRFITEIKLFEVSPVIFAANDATFTVEAKSEDGQAIQFNFMLPDTEDKEAIAEFIKAQLSGFTPGTAAPLDSIDPDDTLIPQSKAIPGYELAEADERCKNCKFYAAVTEKNGYCKQHDESVADKYICDSYERMKAIETIGTTFKLKLADFLSVQYGKYAQLGLLDDEDMEKLNTMSPVLIDNFLDLMPQDIVGREMPNEEYKLPKSDDPEAEPSKDASLTSDKVAAFKASHYQEIAALRKRQHELKRSLS